MPTYLQNPHQAELAAALSAWLSAPCPSGFQLWALADLSILGATALRTIERLASPTFALLDGTRYAAYEEIGPRLIPIIGDSERITESLLAMANTLPALSFLELKTDDCEPRREQLATLACVETPDGLQLYCRFTDTRVLPGVLRVLDHSQRSRVAQTVRRWAWIGRDGHLEAQYLAEANMGSRETRTALSLSDDQFTALMQAAEPDILFGLLREISPEIIPARAPSTIHARLASLLQTARRYGIDDTPDQLQFVTIAWSTSEQFHELESLAGIWAATRSGELRFRDAVMRWTDEQWNEIETMNSDPATAHY
ncbi:DUF4123 domain-containing protein [Aromatoleum petrolei]|uniref:DUF4123 domain-containing protein n=1 Tax=Aromatoleum petrolei TaxID=76116 RepID=A0ABX1MMI8_9RHOO|nr:DUF4123 domain-containing protein [Aromatoleum petrolei]NMF87901.1 DUF4123 domain-containing protein [Aromatoleum petrolei]QTQ36731.1 putative protein DUF4123 [Aromatoleum petrolei]